VNEPVLLELTGALPTDQLGPLLKFVPVEKVLIAANEGVTNTPTASEVITAFRILPLASIVRVAPEFVLIDPISSSFQRRFDLPP
jgi:hypothetical protein